MRKKRTLRRKVKKKRKIMKSRRRNSSVLQRAYLQGRNRAQALNSVHPLEERFVINREWVAWVRSKKFKSWRMYNHAANRFLLGWSSIAHIDIRDYVLLPTEKTVAAIISAQNEEHTIGDVLQQLNRMPLSELIVVINGSTDQSFQTARNYPNTTIVHYPNALGHDVGRAVGAKLSSSEILLFLDADFVIPAKDLIPFIYGIERGYDIALNNITPFLGNFASWDGVTIMKHFANTVLGHRQLHANSLTAVPHAMSKAAMERIGLSNLMVPPKAMQIAIKQNLRIFTPASINVIDKNKHRRSNTGTNNAVMDLIVGDHLEALYPLLDEKPRLDFEDHLRQRKFLQES